MTFAGSSYFLLLLCTALVYWLTPRKMAAKARSAILLIASLLFCAMLDVCSLVWVLATALFSYFMALAIATAAQKKRMPMAHLLLTISLVVLFGTLFGMKYIPFALRTLQTAISWLGGNWMSPTVSIVMAIGISFYVFQVTGYLVDVCKGKSRPVSNFVEYALAVTFFAKFTQGPIDPVAHLTEQFREFKKFDAFEFRSGLCLILIGLFKKMVIADRLAVAANAVFNGYADCSSLTVVIGAVFYAFQLYADFSGYTDIAIGSARLFGFHLVPNFRQPYLATSIGDFWRRWHISLSTWLKDYLYIPLGGSRVSKLRWAMNVLIVFFVSGLWHGANSTFVTWGLIHGGWQVVEKFSAGVRTSIKNRLMGADSWLNKACAVFCTFTIVVAAWVFFRAPTLADGVGMMKRIGACDWTFNLVQFGITTQEWYFSLAMLALMGVVDLVNEHISLVDLIERQFFMVRWGVYLLLIFITILFGMYGSLSAESFIYVSF